MMEEEPTAETSFTYNLHDNRQSQKSINLNYDLSFSYTFTYA